MLAKGNAVGTSPAKVGSPPTAVQQNHTVPRPAHVCCWVSAHLEWPHHRSVQSHGPRRCAPGKRVGEGSRGKGVWSELHIRIAAGTADVTPHHALPPSKFLMLQSTGAFPDLYLISAVSVQFTLVAPARKRNTTLRSSPTSSMQRLPHTPLTRKCCTGAYMMVVLTFTAWCTGHHS